MAATNGEITITKAQPSPVAPPTYSRSPLPYGDYMGFKPDPEPKEKSPSMKMSPASMQLSPGGAEPDEPDDLLEEEPSEYFWCDGLVPLTLFYAFE